MTAFPMLHPSAERARAYREAGYWEGSPVFALFAGTCKRLGDREALVDGERRFGFAEIFRRAECLAAALARHGVVHGTTVTVQLPNWWETVVVYAALARLGAVLNPVLPIYRRSELAFILAEAATEVLIVPGELRGFDHRDLAAELAPNLPRLRKVVVARGAPAGGQLALDELLDEGRTAEGGAASPVAGSDLFLLMYTSGTTADPKGVLHSHDTLAYEARSLERVHGLGPGDTVLMPSPLTHVSGLLHAALLPFVLGTRAVLMDSWDADRALGLIDQERVTYMVGAPIFLSDLTHHPRVLKDPPRSLRLFSCGGAGVSPDLILEARRRLGCVAKRVYGSTEFPTLTTTSAEDPPERGARTEGRPIWAAELRIVDEEDNDLPAGREGEILARGPECFLGYRDSALDAAAFTADGWFRTGDLGVVDADGYLTVTGRKKDIVIRKGEKISAAEVEAAIARHPAVAEVAVVALADPVTGERACACVRLHPGQIAPSLAELGNFLRAQGLATRKLPEAIEVIDDLPRTASGKVQKHRLREAIAARSRPPGRRQP